MPKFVFKEMMFGFRDQFAYGECLNCGCIQIVETLIDIEKYYPPYYMAFTQEVKPLKRQPFLKRVFKNIRLKRKYKKNDNYTLSCLQPINLMPGARILDIGCGKGTLICSLFNLGFENVSGVDKFIDSQVDYGFGVTVLKKELAALPADTYDLLIMHHVLEHIDDQVNELKECYRLLRKGGKLLISIPVLGAAWEKYKENWVQLDAPRHYVLHTLKSIGMLANKTGFNIGKTIFDSTSFQFWGSELYKNDIPLTLPDTHEWYPAESNFTPGQLLEFSKKAEILNAGMRGDSARFYLHKN